MRLIERSILRVFAMKLILLIRYPVVHYLLMCLKVDINKRISWDWSKKTRRSYGYLEIQKRKEDWNNFDFSFYAQMVGRLSWNKKAEKEVNWWHTSRQMGCFCGGVWVLVATVSCVAILIVGCGLHDGGAAEIARGSYLRICLLGCLDSWHLMLLVFHHKQN